MIIDVPYGSEDVFIDLPDANLIAVAEPGEVESPSYEVPSLPFWPELVIVNDASRPTPTADILDLVLNQIPDDALFLIATGTHRAPTEIELEIIFGEHLEAVRDRIRVHDANDSAGMEAIGVTAHGTEVFLNRLCIDAERILVIGSVEPHYFAGYTGGRKAFLPGTAAYSSIEENHSHALDSESMPLALGGNPVHDDAMHAMMLMGAKHIYSIQVVLDRYQDIYAVESGGIVDSFNAAVKKAEEVYVVSVTEKADIVVAIAGSPMDLTLYQAHKAIENAKSVLNKGGIMILVAQCSEGMGNDAFVRLLGESESLKDVIKTVNSGYKLGYHKASKLAELMLESEVWVVSDLSDEAVSDLFMTPVRDLQTAVDTAIEVKGESSRVLVVQDACVTIPYYA